MSLPFMRSIQISLLWQPKQIVDKIEISKNGKSFSTGNGIAWKCPATPTATWLKQWEPLQSGNSVLTRLSCHVTFNGNVFGRVWVGTWHQHGNQLGVIIMLDILRPLLHRFLIFLFWIFIVPMHIFCVSVWRRRCWNVTDENYRWKSFEDYLRGRKTTRVVVLNGVRGFYVKGRFDIKSKVYRRVVKSWTRGVNLKTQCK